MTHSTITPKTLARRFHTLGANVLAVESSRKSPVHKWDYLQTRRQTAEELEKLPWYKADGVGIVNGINGWHSLDFDKCPSFEPIKATLRAMELPENYPWVEQSQSGNGYHIWFLSPDALPPGSLPSKNDETGVYWGNSKDGSFHHVELRWNKSQTIPGAFISGYPKEPPATVDVWAVLKAFHTVAIPVQAEPKNKRASAHKPKDAQIERIKANFDWMEYAKQHFGGEAQLEPNGEIRITGNGGLLINPDEGVWHQFSADMGGDALDLVGYVQFGEAWDRKTPSMFITALEAAAEEVGIRLEPYQPVSEYQAEAAGLISLSEMLSRKPPEWLVDGMIGKGTIAAVVGAPESYKSFLALDMALCLATGRDWADKPVQQGPVIYITPDDTHSMSMRAAAWLRDKDVQDMPPLFFYELPVLFQERDKVDALIAQIQGIDPVLVVVDTINANALGADENSSRDMGEFAEGMKYLRRQTRATVLAVHHIAKATGRSRGSTALPGAWDTELDVKPDRALNRIEVTCGKQRIDERFPDMYFQPRKVFLEGIHEGRSSLVLDFDPEATVVEVPGPSELDSNQQILAQVLVQQFGDRGATFTEWEQACKGRAVSPSTYQRRKKELEDRLLITKKGSRYYPSAKLHSTVMNVL